jgi:hypothetical protein
MQACNLLNPLAREHQDANGAGVRRVHGRVRIFRDRGGEHPEQHLVGYAWLMQADAYAGFNRLYEANRKAGPIIEAA